MALVNEVALDSIPTAMETGSTYHSAHIRRLIKTLAKGVSGVIGGAVTAQGTPNMTVAVAQLTAIITGSLDTLHEGDYEAETFASKTVTIQPADATNDRIDRVVIGCYNQEYTGSRYAGVLGIVQGTPAGSPAVPAMPVDGTFFELAQVRVRHGTASILSTDITDVRLLFSPTVSGPLYPTGINGFQGSTRDLGLITAGPPSGFAALQGDKVLDQRGLLWACSTAGTPGTWLAPGWWKFIADQVPTGSTFTVTVPTWCRHIAILWTSKTNQATAPILWMRFNGDAGTNYEYVLASFIATVTPTAPTSASPVANLRIGVAGNTSAGLANSGEVVIFNANGTGLRRYFRAFCSRNDDGGFGWESLAGDWQNTVAGVTSITIFPATGNLASANFSFLGAP